jgi:predicted phage terminase large subunit-like protein
VRLGTPTIFPAERIDLDDTEAFLMPPSTGGVAIPDRDPTGGWYVKQIRRMAESNENVHKNLRESMKPCLADESQINDTETPVQKAAHDLLTYTKLTYPAYRADRFHAHLADEITDLVMNAKKGISTKLMVFAPPQSGKLTALTTPVLTTRGWIEHGDIVPGDMVFGRDGKPTPVLALSTDSMSTLEVEFTDGSIIKCHPAHEWLVFDRAHAGGGRPYEPSVWETRQMLAVPDLWRGPRGKRGGRARFQVDTNVRVQGWHQTLPIPPYVLGAWLGDGSTRKNCITHHPDDIAVVRRFAALGIERTACDVHRSTGVHTSYFKSLYQLLRANNLLNNKHIPAAYLAASVEDRLELLAGLMDTDGYIYPVNGRACFSNTNEALVGQVASLVASLGWRPTVAEFAPCTSSSGIVGTKVVFQVTFNPDEKLPCVLERKAVESGPLARRRGIVDIRPCKAEPGRCIQVAAEDGIYLTGRNLVPTHNSELVSTRTPGFWLANNQDLPVGLVSYAASLANRNSRQARDVLATQQFFDIFRDMRDPLNWRQNDWHLLNRKGYCLAVGVGGAITGHGFGLGIIDDPVENWAAAQSETLRESIWAWWNGTFTTRLWQNASLLFIMTRWNEDDLAARILANEGRVEEGGSWKVLSYPALSLGEGDILNRPEGEPLAPSRYGKEYLDDLREKLGEYVWNAEYQQNPTPPKGSMFKVGRIEIVNAVPAEIAEIEWDASDPAAFPEIISVKRGTRFWDLAGTEKDVDKPDPDSTASALTVVFNDKTYILDVTNDRLEPEQVETLMLQTARVDGVRVKVRLEQEPGQSGKSQVGSYTKLLKGFDVGGIPSSGDKRVRASPLAAQVNAGNVIMLRGPWNRKFLDQIANFPFGKHDDMVDASSTSFNHETGVTRLFRKIGFKHV